MAMASSLRALAKAYAGGQIDKAKYRTDRTAFIEAVLSGALSIKNQSSGQPAVLSSESRVNAADKTTLMGSGNGNAEYNAIPNEPPRPESRSAKKTRPDVRHRCGGNSSHHHRDIHPVR